MYVALNKSVCQIYKCKVVAWNGDYTPSRRLLIKPVPPLLRNHELSIVFASDLDCYVKHLSVDKEHKTKGLKPEDLS